MNILAVVVEICEKNELKYYLIGGTLLGAIRHEGFIPWDDDLDICMPRKDFNRFIQIAADELPDYYELLWNTTEKRYWLPFAKVANKNTLFEEESNHQANRLYGIFVDIFPLDSSRGYSKILQVRSNIVRKLKVAMFQKAGARKCNGVKKIVKLVPWHVIHSILESIMVGSKKDQNGKNYSSFCSQYSIKKQTMPKEWYGEGVSVQFEDRKYCAPQNYTSVLESIFSENYMELPPLEKRRTHYPMKVIFSDGETMTFEKTNNKNYVE